MKRQMKFILQFAGVCAVAGAVAANAQPSGAPTGSQTVVPGVPTTNPTFPDPDPNPTPAPLPKPYPASTPVDGVASAPNSVAAPKTVPTSNVPTALVGVNSTAPISRADRNLSRKARLALTQAFPKTPGANGAAATGGISGLKVISRNGKLTLEGTVGTQAQKDAAEAKAASIAGGAANVDDQLMVK